MHRIEQPHEVDTVTAWMADGNCRNYPAGGVLPERWCRRRPGPQDLHRLPGRRRSAWNTRSKSASSTACGVAAASASAVGSSSGRRVAS